MTELKPCPRPDCQSSKISMCGDYSTGIQIGCMDCHFGTEKHNSRAKAVKAWNARSGYSQITFGWASKDRELLIELSLPDQSTDDLKEWYLTSHGKNDTPKIALRIRKHLEENP